MININDICFGIANNSIQFPALNECWFATRHLDKSLKKLVMKLIIENYNISHINFVKLKIINPKGNTGFWAEPIEFVSKTEVLNICKKLSCLK